MVNNLVQQSEELFNSAETLNNIYTKYPRLKKYITDVEIRQNLNPDWEYGMGQLEFFPVGEINSPSPDKTVIEIYNPNLKGEWLEQAVFGDMLHGLPNKDPEFTELRNQFKDSLTGDQMKLAVDMYERQEATSEHPPREFDKAFDVSILDGFVRGYIAPDEHDEWRQTNFYTDEQKGILDNMVNLLQQGEE
jgi:hypothetical protein|tara:strand:+ start:70 stop:642 length:573 start_codon:yes stop_codon:yes gene_type:complete